MTYFVIKKKKFVFRLTNGSILINSSDVYVIPVVVMTMLVYIAICIVIAIKFEKINLYFGI